MREHQTMAVPDHTPGTQTVPEAAQSIVQSMTVLFSICSSFCAFYSFVYGFLLSDVHGCLPPHYFRSVWHGHLPARLRLAAERSYSFVDCFYFAGSEFPSPVCLLHSTASHFCPPFCYRCPSVCPSCPLTGTFRLYTVRVIFSCDFPANSVSSITFQPFSGRSSFTSDG